MPGRGLKVTPEPSIPTISLGLLLGLFLPFLDDSSFFFFKVARFSLDPGVTGRS